MSVCVYEWERERGRETWYYHFKICRYYKINKIQIHLKILIDGYFFKQYRDNGAPDYLGLHPAQKPTFG